MRKELRCDLKVKKFGCGHFALIVIVLLVFLNLISKPKEETSTTIGNVNNATVISQKENTPKNTKNDMPLSTKTENTEAPVSTAEPATEEEWVQYAALDVYKDDLISVELVDVDKNAPMIEVYCVFADNWTKSLRRDMFMFKARDFMKSIVELSNNEKIEYESVFIHGRTTFLDKYGNESEGDAMSIRVYASELQKVNWDNITIDMLQNLAISYAVHPLFRD